MPTTDPRIDAYIERSAEFAQPILDHIRKLIHEAFPDMIETMKWSFPHFDFKGTVCSMASFKQHCAFGFWKQSLLEKDAFPSVKTAMGSFGRITSVKDLPDNKTMIKLIRDAVKLNIDGVKVPKTKKAEEKKDLTVPKDLKSALGKNAKAKETFENFSYSNKKEYVAWIEDAKSDATRQKRLSTAIEWMNDGKIRNWKYVR